jgi:hypothetical protein
MVSIAARDPASTSSGTSGLPPFAPKLERHKQRCAGGHHNKATQNQDAPITGEAIDRCRRFCPDLCFRTLALICYQERFGSQALKSAFRRSKGSCGLPSDSIQPVFGAASYLDSDSEYGGDRTLMVCRGHRCQPCILELIGFPQASYPQEILETS